MSMNLSSLLETRGKGASIFARTFVRLFIFFLYTPSAKPYPKTFFVYSKKWPRGRLVLKYCKFMWISAYKFDFLVFILYKKHSNGFSQSR